MRVISLPGLLAKRIFCHICKICCKNSLIKSGKFRLTANNNRTLKWAVSWESLSLGVSTRSNTYKAVQQQQKAKIERRICIKPAFWPPHWSQKNQMPLYNINIGLLYKVNDPSVSLHINSTLMVAMVTENGHKNRLK